MPKYEQLSTVLCVVGAATLVLVTVYGNGGVVATIVRIFGVGYVLIGAVIGIFGSTRYK